MAPVVFALKKRVDVAPLVLVTGQHREQLDSVLSVFGIEPDVDLRVMRDRQSLPALLARIVPDAAETLRRLAPDYLLVHGDTSTTFAVALAAFYEGIPTAHVEAGLRTFNLSEPFPEEANRRLTDVLTDLDLPPTPGAKANLLAEGKREETMVVTGNTEVDAVRYAAERASLPAHLPSGPLVTVTMHRRENFPVLARLAEALADVAQMYPQVTFVYPVHLSPFVRDAVLPALGEQANVVLEEPYDYLSMIALMRASTLIVTDSGGLQEDGASLGVPVVVLRNLTERPEGVEAGIVTLAGNEPGRVRKVVGDLLSSRLQLGGPVTAENPYGDGRAGQRIAQAVAWRMGLSERPVDWRPAMNVQLGA